MPLLLLILVSVAFFSAGPHILPTRDRAVELALRNSYQVRQLRLNIKRNTRRLEAERANLKSKVYLDFQAPEFQAISDYKWNSEQQKYETIKENTR